MNGFSLDGGDNAQGTVFRDLIMLALLGFVALVIIMLPWVQPPGSKNQASVDPPGNVIVEARWPDEVDADVDLWVQAPGDRPVGYSNKGGAVFNLLRDDLGKRSDATGLNYETSYSRGIPAGEYTVNLHMYRNSALRFPLPVSVAVSLKHDSQARAKQILASDLSLKREGEEVTVFRFALDNDGALVPGSVHSLAKPLRTWRTP